MPKLIVAHDRLPQTVRVLCPLPDININTRLQTPAAKQKKIFTLKRIVLLARMSMMEPSGMARRLAAGAILSAPRVDKSTYLQQCSRGNSACRLLKWPPGGNNHQTVERGQDHCKCSQPWPPLPCPPPAAEAEMSHPLNYKQLVSDRVPSGFKSRFLATLDWTITWLSMVLDPRHHPPINNDAFETSWEDACCVMVPCSVGVHPSRHGHACISHDSHELVY